MALPPRTGMGLHFGIRITAADQDRVAGEMEAGDRHVNTFGIVHGGALMAVGDELGGLTTRPNGRPPNRRANRRARPHSRPSSDAARCRRAKLLGQQ